MDRKTAVRVTFKGSRNSGISSIPFIKKHGLFMTSGKSFTKVEVRITYSYIPN